MLKFVRISTAVPGVSFTCKINTKIKINDKQETCNQAINFINRPKSLQINEGENKIKSIIFYNQRLCGSFQGPAS